MALSINQLTRMGEDLVTRLGPLWTFKVGAPVFSIVEISRDRLAPVTGTDWAGQIVEALSKPGSA